MGLFDSEGLEKGLLNFLHQFRWEDTELTMPDTGLLMEMDVTFVTNSSGHVTGLVIDKLSDVNGGKFVKIQ